MDKILNFISKLGQGPMAKIVTCALILIIGLIIIKIVMTIIKRALAKSKLEKAAHSLIKSVAKIIMFTLLGFMAVSALGIDVTGVVALASVVSLALSLAMQNALANLIGGFTLLNTHPFQSGDYVEIAAQSGTVNEIGMAYTKLTTPDNKLIQIPNANVVASEIINYSATGTRRITIDISVSYDTKIEKVIAALKEAADVEGILDEKGIFATATGYGENLIAYTLRVWTKTDDYWDINYLIIRNIKEVFDREEIRMTYSNINVQLNESAKKD